MGRQGRGPIPGGVGEAGGGGGFCGERADGSDSRLLFIHLSPSLLLLRLVASVAQSNSLNKNKTNQLRMNLLLILECSATKKKFNPFITLVFFHLSKAIKRHRPPNSLNTETNSHDSHI